MGTLYTENRDGWKGDGIMVRDGVCANSNKLQDQLVSVSCVFPALMVI